MKNAVGRIFARNRDIFNHELERIQDEEDVYKLGIYETPRSEALAVKNISGEFAARMENDTGQTGP